MDIVRDSKDKIISESGQCYQEINQKEGKMLTGSLYKGDSDVML